MNAANKVPLTRFTFHTPGQKFEKGTMTKSSFRKKLGLAYLVTRKEAPVMAVVRLIRNRKSSSLAYSSNLKNAGLLRLHNSITNLLGLPLYLTPIGLPEGKVTVCAYLRANLVESERRTVGADRVVCRRTKASCMKNEKRSELHSMSAVIKPFKGILVNQVFGSLSVHFSAGFWAD
ncbi:hypothetical protein L1049_008086 [Liquidambar formosana]|uniref:Uncharacterized protein n=1 Tax=Liquidambar formosana TaxID=63359 RepID=A0AAP0S953_LIQFO